jgi:hypothetical protein
MTSFFPLGRNDSRILFNIHIPLVLMADNAKGPYLIEEIN